MTIHIEQSPYYMAKCGNFEDGDDFEQPEEGIPSDCLECIHFDEVQEEWEKYLKQPINWGGDNFAVRIAEHDAFFAAAFVFIAKKYPF